MCVLRGWFILQQLTKGQLQPWAMQFPDPSMQHLLVSFRICRLSGPPRKKKARREKFDFIGLRSPQNEQNSEFGMKEGPSFR